MQRTIDGPDSDWLTEEEAVNYMRLPVNTFRALVDAGFIVGVRKLSRQATLYHWRGLVVAQWRLELGDLPPEGFPEKVAKSGEK